MSFYTKDGKYLGGPKALLFKICGIFFLLFLQDCGVKISQLVTIFFRLLFIVVILIIIIAILPEKWIDAIINYFKKKK